MKNVRMIALLFLLPLCIFVYAQTRSVTEDPESLRQMLAHQPDYTAMGQFIFSEGFGGTGGKSKVAKMGNRQAEIDEDVIHISEGEKLINVYPKRKEYSEMTIKLPAAFAISPEELAKRNGVIFRSLGKEKVGKYSCIKIEVSYKDEKLKDMKFLFWSTPELKNLIVRSEISLGSQVKFITVLDDVSLGANEELFRIPADYKRVTEPDYMKELEKNIPKSSQPSARPK
jgi:hypothetical protein